MPHQHLISDEADLPLRLSVFPSPFSIEHYRGCISPKIFSAFTSDQLHLTHFRYGKCLMFNRYPYAYSCMMTSSNGTIFCVTGPMCAGISPVTNEMLYIFYLSPCLVVQQSFIHEEYCILFMQMVSFRCLSVTATGISDQLSEVSRHHGQTGHVKKYIHEWKCEFDKQSPVK